jgi:protoporphyrinogen oxidase
VNAAPTIVIGAGPAGLGAALALGDRALVLEGGRDAGGLASTLTFGGAVFDLGGHSFHTPHDEVRSLVFDALPMEEQARNATCFVKGEIIPYPFQRHFERLSDARIVAECRAGLERTDSQSAQENLDRHLEHFYGSGITRHFLRPYNEKLWGPDLTRLAVDWTGERIAGSPGEARRKPLASGQTVAYPKEGGFGEIFRALSTRVPGIRYDTSVKAIHPRDRTLETSRGETLSWERLVSTMPLPKLLELLPDVPSELRESVDRLVALPLALVMIAMKGRIDSPIQRVYCVGDEMPAHKVALNHNSSASLRAMPNHGILAEVSRAGRSGTASAEELTRDVVAGMKATGILDDEKRIAATRVVEVAFGYPVPTHERAAIVAEARHWLDRRGIHTLGRFGEWAYINSDEALYRGLNLGRELCETTS